MRAILKTALLLVAALSLLSFVACSDDDDGGTTPPPAADPWIGQWLSAETNVAPLLVTLFQYDSVRVWINENQTVRLDTHVDGGAWTTINGTYSVTESASGSVHSIELIYSAFEQGGIIQVTEGTPDTMKLEAVQTTPNIGAVPRTPTTGFGSDVALGTLNIQNYVREE